MWARMNSFQVVVHFRCGAAQCRFDVTYCQPSRQTADPRDTQGADNAVVAPVAILSGHSYHQLFEFAFHSGATRVAPLFGAIELGRDKPTVPT